MVRVMEWAVDPDADVPPSRQLVEQVLDAIARGELEPGAQLPSVRALAAEALVNHNTVARAYLELERLGATEGVNGVGVFVTLRGPEVALAARRATTLEALRRVLAEALRAGHSFDDVHRLLKEEAWSRRSA
ncbi:MAG: GntR family transcriptional regulator [Planctomycetes bacterium]|nr:GntR family transcriptional regulator [Planctomycetota bacterium]